MALTDEVAKIREKIEQMLIAHAIVTQRLDTVWTDGGETYDTLQDVERRVADIRREMEKETSLLRREVEDLKKWRDEWGKRAWSLAPVLISAVLGGLIALGINYFLPRR